MDENAQCRWDEEDVFSWEEEGGQAKSVEPGRVGAQSEANAENAIIEKVSSKIV